MEYLDIVDENDKIVSSASQDECHQKGYLHRTVEIFIFKNNSLEEILIQKRGIRNEFRPGKLCASAGGHLIKGESYYNGGIRELGEELFIKGVPKVIKLKKVDKFKINDYPGNNEIKLLFYTIYNGPFDWNKNELAERPKFVKIKNLIEDIKKHPKKYTDAFKISLPKLLDKMQKNHIKISSIQK